jgi:hypothetical protein
VFLAEARSGSWLYDSRREDMSLRARTVPISSQGTTPFRNGRSRLPCPLIGRAPWEFTGSARRRKRLSRRLAPDCPNRVCSTRCERASVRRHQRAQGGSPMLRSM